MRPGLPQHAVSTQHVPVVGLLGSLLGINSQIVQRIVTIVGELPTRTAAIIANHILQNSLYFIILR